MRQRRDKLGTMQAAGHWRTNARLFVGLKRIHIHAHAETGRTVPYHGERLVEHYGQTALPDVSHVEHPYPQPAQQRRFARLVTAHANQAHMLRAQLGFCTAIAVSTASPWPSRQASGMPWICPLGVVTKVWLSM